MSSKRDLLLAYARAFSRVKGIVVILTAAVSLVALIWFVPFDQYRLAAIMSLGFGVLVGILAFHSLQLTRWSGQLQHATETQTLERQRLAEALARLQRDIEAKTLEGQRVEERLARFDSYTHASDLNIGRLATRQAKLLEANLEARLLEVERGFDRAGSRLGAVEARAAQADAQISQLAKLGRDVRDKKLEKRLLEFEHGFDHAGVRLSECEARAAKAEARILDLERFQRVIRADIDQRSTNETAEKSLEQISKVPSPAEQFHIGLKAIGIVQQHDLDLTSTGERRFLSLFAQRFPGATIFDVGAHLGVYATLARRFDKTANVHAFEPHPGTFGKLKLVAAEHGFVPHRLAMGDKKGTVNLFDYACSQSTGSEHASIYREAIEELQEKGACKMAVPCETVGGIAAKLGIDHLHLLKIDVEGHELHVLKGAGDLLTRSAIDVIQFEFNEMNVYSRTFFRDFVELLRDYHFYRLLPNSVLDLGNYSPTDYEIFAWQNIVCLRNGRSTGWLDS